MYIYYLFKAPTIYLAHDVMYIGHVRLKLQTLNLETYQLVEYCSQSSQSLQSLMHIYKLQINIIKFSLLLIKRNAKLSIIHSIDLLNMTFVCTFCLVST